MAIHVLAFDFMLNFMGAGGGGRRGDGYMPSQLA